MAKMRPEQDIQDRRHAPSPGNPGGLRGHLFNVCTEPDHRGRGYARDCLKALLDWFATDTTVSVVDLNATAGSGNLYQSMGFAPARHPALQLRRDQMSALARPVS